MADCFITRRGGTGGSGEFTAGMTEFAQALENQPVFGAVTEEE